ncbi:hypothetical protein CRG98_009117 [Punica granatum]|uniref:Uncharacterized protein n=1 Tax=Punica granatum TaxID=22663 RepID=A0A2I0KQ93_PUNGR|nr:hypothetical protein CRG98_009117 [Punica granatum]
MWDSKNPSRCQSDQRHVRERFGGILLKPGHPRTLTDAFSGRAHGRQIRGQVNGTRKRACTHSRTTGTIRTAFRNSTWPPEGRLNGHERLSANLRDIFMTNRDHSDPRTPQGIRQLLSKSLSSPSPLPHFVQPISRPKPAKTDGKPPAVKRVGSREPPPSAPSSLDVPFPSTTLASRAIKFKGFLTTLSLPREEVVTVREPYDRAQPPFRSFLLVGFHYFYRVFPQRFWSPRSPTLHRAMVGVIVPTSFPPSYRCRCSRVSIAHHVQPGHPTLSPLPRLFPAYIEAR